VFTMYICVYVKSFVEKKKKLQEDVARLETEIEDLRASHDVGSSPSNFTLLTRY